MSAFIMLRTASSIDLHLAVDEIASFMPYDKYRPGNMSLITMKGGEVYTVVENTDAIASAIQVAMP